MRPPKHTPRGPVCRGVVAVAALSLVLTACSSDEGSQAPGASATAPASGRPDAAGQAVQAGLAKHVKNDLKGARAEYERALTLDPKNALALYNLGLLAQTRGDTAEAEKRYRAVLAVNPDYQPAVFNLAIVRKSAGDKAEAERLYRRAIALRPGDAGAHLNLGLLLRETGDLVKGDAEVATALKLNPNFVDPAK